MYSFFLDGVLLPVAPEKMSIKIKNQNKTMTLINDGEINILKSAGLTEIDFDALIPALPYSFARYQSTFQSTTVYLSKLEQLKSSKKPFQFIVVRSMPNGTPMAQTNMKVSLESYTITESVKDGFDTMVNIKLKQYKEYGTKVVQMSKNTISTEPQRSTENAPEPETETTHNVQTGDCLWTIAKKYYGDGSKYGLIYEANKNLIDGANAGKGLNKYTVYTGQNLVIPVEVSS